MNLELWNIQTAHAGAVYALALDREQGTLYSGGADCVVASWSVDLKHQLGITIKTSASIYSLYFEHVHRMLYIGLSDGSLHVVQVDQKQEVASMRIHSAGIYDIAYDERNQWIWTCGGDGGLNIWDAQRLTRIRSIPFAQEKLRQLAIHPKGEIMAVAGKALWTIDMAFANELSVVEAHEQGTTAVAWMTEKNVLLSGGKDGFLRVWTPDTKQVLLEIQAHKFAIYRIVVDTQNRWCFTASRDGSIKVWSTMDFSHVKTIEKSRNHHTHSVNALLYLDQSAYSAGDDRRIIRWKCQ